MSTSHSLVFRLVFLPPFNKVLAKVHCKPPNFFIKQPSQGCFF
jgi:hypothetical protein